MPAEPILFCIELEFIVLVYASLQCLIKILNLG